MVKISALLNLMWLGSCRTQGIRFEKNVRVRIDVES